MGSKILLHTSDGEVPLGYISQGMTSTLGWIGPMIQRLCEIHGSAKGQHAILLIDEIERHLHPAWQQKLDQILTDEAFGLERARTSEWKEREKYAALLGKTDRTASEEAELAMISESIRKMTGPSETPAERRAAIDAEREPQSALEAAAASLDSLSGGSRDEGGMAG